MLARRHVHTFEIASACLFVAVLQAGCDAPADAPGRALDYGRNALEEGRWAEARQWFGEGLEHRPDEPTLLRWAAVAWASGTEQSAGRGLPFVLRFLEVVPEDADMRIQAVRWSLFVGDHAQASALAEALPDGYEKAMVRANLWLDDQPSAAASAAAEALAMAPERAGAYAILALAAERQGDLPRAVAAAEQAANLDPLASRNHYRLGQLRRRVGDLEGARRAFAAQQVVATIDGEGSLRTPTPVEALRLLRELASMVASDAPALRLRLAKTLAETGRRDEARAILPELAPPAAPVLEVGALAQTLAAGEMAAGWYRAACTGEGAFADVERRESCYRLALLAQAGGDATEAALAVDTLLARDPWVARGYRLRAALAAAAGRTGDEIAALEEALALAPWHVEDRVRLAEHYLAAGRRREARILLDAAPEPSDILARFRSDHGLG